jgi:GNAT superfamily N-acetyltransferase
MNYTMKIKPVPQLIKQPDGYSCGATAVKMALGLLNIRMTIAELKPMFSTNPDTGTTHEGMIAGFQAMNIPFTLTISNNTPFETLDAAIAEDKVFLMRTLISGCKHWILVYAKLGDDYLVADPVGYFWTLTPKKAQEIWGARAYDGFIIDHSIEEEVVIRRIHEDEVDEALYVGYESFRAQIPYQTATGFKGTVMGSVGDDTYDCWVAVHNGDIIGGYFLGHNQMWGKDYEDQTGLQGVALFLLPEYRGMKIGDALRRIPLSVDYLNYDYVWGMHMSCLKNVKNWTKFGRKEVENYGGVHTTVMDLREKRAQITV